EVVQRTDAAPAGAGDERVSDLKRAAHDQDRHDRAAARVELRLDHGAGRRCVRVGAQLHQLRLCGDRVKQVVKSVAGARGYVDKVDVSTPFDRLQTDLRHLGA